MQSGQRSNLSKVIRLPSAGAKLGAQARLPRLLPLWEGVRKQETGAGSDMSQVQAACCPAAHTTAPDSLQRACTSPQCCQQPDLHPGQTQALHSSQVPDSRNIWSKSSSAFLSRPQPPGHLDTSPRGSFFQSVTSSDEGPTARCGPRPPSRVLTCHLGKTRHQQNVCAFGCEAQEEAPNLGRRGAQREVENYGVSLYRRNAKIPLLDRTCRKVRSHRNGNLTTG